MSRGTDAGAAVDPAPLDVRSLSAGYRRGEPVVVDVSFSLRAGTTTALVGPNGAGKSTLIRALLGLVPFATSERVAFFGRDLAAARHRIAYVPQRTQIDWDFPASALDVAAMGAGARLGMFRRAGDATREAARAALAEVGLAEAARVPIGSLSGGQQQRLLVARALAQDADLLLLDEPFANVDAVSEARLAQTFRSLAARGRTILAVHHDLRSVRAHFDEAILLHRHVLAHGPAAEATGESMLARAYGFARGETA